MEITHGIRKSLLHFDMPNLVVLRVATANNCVEVMRNEDGMASQRCEPGDNREFSVLVPGEAKRGSKTDLTRCSAGTRLYGN